MLVETEELEQEWVREQHHQAQRDGDERAAIHDQGTGS